MCRCCKLLIAPGSQALALSQEPGTGALLCTASALRAWQELFLSAQDHHSFVCLLTTHCINHRLRHGM